MTSKTVQFLDMQHSLFIVTSRCEQTEAIEILIFDVFTLLSHCEKDSK